MPESKYFNEQNLRDCEYMVVPWRKSEESLVFEASCI